VRRGAHSGAVAFGRRAGALLGAAMGWGLFEAGWPRLRELELDVPGLPAELDGLRIVHLSDFHLGVPSRGVHAVEQGVAWAAERKPDVVAITGDLLTHPRGESRLRSLVERLPQPVFAVLGNHDLAIARDPMARKSNLEELRPACLLEDEGELIELRGKQVWIAGTDPRPVLRRKEKTDPNTLSRGADFRILLSHFPRVFDRLEPGSFDLVLAGHMHDGQITIPYPGGKLRLAHPTARYASGVYRSRAGVMHVSPGLGTTFVPFRFGARPEATELVLRSPRHN
jgi:predicted MPP superfamily phosphohydrolase